MQTPYDIAHSLLGKGEVPDRQTLSEFMANGGQNLDPVTTAWCAAFVNASLGKAGVEGTGKLNARSFMDWGQPVDQPQRGDVAVFSRGDPNGWQGHVGFFEGYNPDGTIRVLGGNQGNEVGIGSYDPDSLLGFRRAPETGNALRGPDFIPQPQQPAGNALAMPDFSRSREFIPGMGVDPRVLASIRGYA
jgi:uncharacterized protein (TIGR02594 family)